MKNITSITRLVAVLISAIFISMAFTNEANAQGIFQKRKYRKGFYINLGGNKKAVDQKSAEVEADEPQVNINSKAVSTVEESLYELPFVSDELAYENVEFSEIAVETESVKLRNTANTLAFNEVASSVAGELRKWNSLRQKLDPKGNAEQMELDPLLKKSILFAVAAVAVSIFSSIIGWFAFGWLFSFLAWMVAVAFWICALYFFIKWLLEQ